MNGITSLYWQRSNGFEAVDKIKTKNSTFHLLQWSGPTHINHMKNIDHINQN